MNKQNRITVVGSNMIDLTSFLKRFPQKGETVFGKEFQQGFGGKGSNQAIMASLLGAEVSMVTTVGEDTYAEEWLEHYKKEGINTDFVKIVEGDHSGIAAIWVEPDGENRIVISSGANDALSPEYINQVFDQLPDTSIVLSQLENPQESILEGFKRGKEIGATTILNPAPAEALLAEMLEYTDWLLPNETELAFLAKSMYNLSTENPIETIKEFAQLTNTNIAVTIGAKGALLYMPQEDMDVEHIETISVDVKDTTGAGDAFCGTFAYGLMAGFEPQKAIKLANIIASDSVQRIGTQKSYARDEALIKLMNSTFGENNTKSADKPK